MFVPLPCALYLAFLAHNLCCPVNWEYNLGGLYNLRTYPNCTILPNDSLSSLDQ